MGSARRGGRQRDVTGHDLVGGSSFKSVVKTGLLEQVTFELRLEGQGKPARLSSEGAFQAEDTARAKALR